MKIVKTKTKDYDCTAEVVIYVLGQRVGVVGGSRHVSTVEEEADQVIRDAYFEVFGDKLAEAIRNDPRVNQETFAERSDRENEGYEPHLKNLREILEGNAIRRIR